MSLFGAINTAISGLAAQSAAFGNISDNVANSQSVGFKRVDTSFVDYLTTSTATDNESGAVVAEPDYVNNTEGTVTQTDNPLALAITGQGFFAVSQQTGTVSGVPTFNSQQFYTREGDFSMNSTGYLVNSTGAYLNGWTVDLTTHIADQNAITPIQISQSRYNPVATSNVTLSANLPATPTSGTATASAPISSQITVYDALGTSHTVDLNWSQAADSAGNPLQNDWIASISVPDDTVQADRGSAEVLFGQAAADSTVSPNIPAATAGTIGEIKNATGSVSSTGFTATGQAATLSFSADFGSGPQNITLNLGQYGGTTGLTQFAGTTYDQRGLTQDGVPPGSFSGVTMQDNGNVVVNYNNGQSRTVAQIPIVTFNDPNQLQRQNGQSFTATTGSGAPLASAVGANGAGSLVTGSVEGSNVDIATEFSQLIVAQQAYSANAKVVTSSDQMLQITINMKT